MQPITSFNENVGTAILLLGPPGSGKTVLGCRLFPNTYVLVADLNFRSGLSYLSRIKEETNIVGYDSPAFDENGKRTPCNTWYDRMFKCLVEAANNPKVDCIFVDSVTFVEDYIKAKICGAVDPAQIRIEGFDKWATYMIVWKSLIYQLRQCGKKSIFSCHEEHEKDEGDMIFKYRPQVDGQMKNKFGPFFSDVWRCEVAENMGKHTWNVRTLGNIQHALKSTFDLPHLLPQDELVKKVRAQIHPQS